MSLVQIKGIYGYNTPFFIGEEELVECDFQTFKEHLVREVPHPAKNNKPLYCATSYNNA